MRQRRDLTILEKAQLQPVHAVQSRRRKEVCSLHQDQHEAISDSMSPQLATSTGRSISHSAVSLFPRRLENIQADKGCHDRKPVSPNSMCTRNYATGNPMV
jgi:hypothetical protein